MPKAICIIPARGGSKRIPKKNIKDFLGKPIIAYSIEVALKSGLFDEVMVSTDSEEIAAIAKHYGASVPFFRSASNSDDFATTMDVIQEVIQLYKERNENFDFACCMYPTAPFVKASHLQKGLELLEEADCKTVFPVVEFSYPIWRGLSVESNGQSSMIWPEHLNSRSQDLEKVYHDAGQWYWMNVNSVGNSLFSDDSKSIILDPLLVQDIDSEADWRIAEMKYRLS